MGLPVPPAIVVNAVTNRFSIQLRRGHFLLNHAGMAMRASAASAWGNDGSDCACFIGLITSFCRCCAFVVEAAVEAWYSQAKALGALVGLGVCLYLLFSVIAGAQWHARMRCASRRNLSSWPCTFLYRVMWSLLLRDPAVRKYCHGCRDARYQGTPDATSIRIFILAARRAGKSWCNTA